MIALKGRVERVEVQDLCPGKVDGRPRPLVVSAPSSERAGLESRGSHERTVFVEYGTGVHRSTIYL